VLQKKKKEKTKTKGSEWDGVRGKSTGDWTEIGWHCPHCCKGYIFNNHSALYKALWMALGRSRELLSFYLRVLRWEKRGDTKYVFQISKNFGG
jgi:hypothetical protein